VLNLVGTAAVFSESGALAPAGFVAGLLPFVFFAAWVVAVSVILVQRMGPELRAEPPPRTAP
jgi:hypothetical protein